jgi:hypothetical protein
LPHWLSIGRDASAPLLLANSVDAMCRAPRPR